MLKKFMATLLCTTFAVASLTSCGKELTLTTGDKTGDKNNSSSADGNSSSDNQSAVSVKNFTAPEKGEQIIIMKIKDYGEVKIKLFPEYADKGVENFVTHAKNGYYNGLTFHRVIKDFMIQGGDPLGTGTGGTSIWGEKFEGGTDPHLIHAAGALAYANSGATSTNGSQFYIVTGEVYDEAGITQIDSYYHLGLTAEEKEIYKTIGGAPWLDGGYTLFGQVFDGLDVVFEIQNVATNAGNNKPLESVIMESVTVGEYDGEELRWYISDYE